MKKIFILLLAVSFSTIALSQKVKLKKGIVYIDAVAKHKIKTEAVSEVTISNIQSDKEEIFAFYKDYKNSDLITKSNPEGKVRWIEITFLDFNKKVEISSRGRKGIIKFLISNKVYVNGIIDEKAIDKIITKYGVSSFSNQRPNQNIRVIINN